MIVSFGLAIIVLGLVAGFLVVLALSIVHDHGDRGIVSNGVGRRFATQPLVARRASTALLDEYLFDEREAGAAQRHAEQSRIIAGVVRGSTVVLEDYLYDAGAVSGVPAHTPHAEPAPVALAGGREWTRVDRMARPTRLVPLAPELATG